MRFQQLKRDPNSVMRKKLVKSKKAWVVVSSLSIAGGLLMMTAPSYVAKAEVTTAAPTTQTETKPSSMGTTSQDSSKVTVPATSAPAPTTTDDGSGSKTAEVPTTKPAVESGTEVKSTEDASDLTKESTPETTPKETSETAPTVKDAPVEAPSTETETAAPDTKVAALSVAAPTTGVGQETTVNGNSTVEKTVATPDDGVVKDATNLDLVGLKDSSLDDAALSENLLTTKALADVTAPVTPTVKTSGTGWGVSGTKLTISGALSSDPTDYQGWGGNSSTITDIDVPTTVTAPKDSSYLFADMPSLTSVNMANLDMSKTTTTEGMFKNDSSLKNLDLSKTYFTMDSNISHMFENDTNLGTIKFGGHNNTTNEDSGSPFKKIVDGSYAFANCISLTQLISPNDDRNTGKNISSTNSWIVSSDFSTYPGTRDLRGMFKNDSSLDTIYITTWAWPAGTITGDSFKGEGMFDGTNLESIKINSSLKFDSNTALTSNKGINWTESTYNQSFSGIPKYDDNNNLTNGLGFLYNGNADFHIKGSQNDEGRSTPISLLYIANGVPDANTVVTNLVTIHTTHDGITSDITAKATGTYGSTVEVEVPESYKFDPNKPEYTTTTEKVNATLGFTQTASTEIVPYSLEAAQSGSVKVSTSNGSIINIPVTATDTDTVGTTTSTTITNDQIKTLVPGYHLANDADSTSVDVTFISPTTADPTIVGTSTSSIVLVGDDIAKDVNGSVLTKQSTAKDAPNTPVTVTVPAGSIGSPSQPIDINVPGYEPTSVIATTNVVDGKNVVTYTTNDDNKTVIDSEHPLQLVGNTTDEDVNGSVLTKQSTAKDAPNTPVTVTVPAGSIGSPSQPIAINVPGYEPTSVIATTNVVDGKNVVTYTTNDGNNTVIDSEHPLQLVGDNTNEDVNGSVLTKQSTAKDAPNTPVTVTVPAGSIGSPSQPIDINVPGYEPTSVIATTNVVDGKNVVTYTTNDGKNTVINSNQPLVLKGQEVPTTTKIDNVLTKQAGKNVGVAVTVPAGTVIGTPSPVIVSVPGYEPATVNAIVSVDKNGVYSVSYVTDDKAQTTIDNNAPLNLKGQEVPAGTKVAGVMTEQAGVKTPVSVTIPDGAVIGTPTEVTVSAPGYVAQKVMATIAKDANGIYSVTYTTSDSNKTAIDSDAPLALTRKPSSGSSTVKPVDPTEGVIEQKVQTISTYSDKPDVELYQLGSDNKMSQITNRSLATASNWYSDATVTIDGVSYYRVATNEWAKMSQAYPYQALNLHIRTYNDSEKALYKAENIVISNETLAPSSSWITDRETYVINNTKYYRVATNEFVNADDVYIYSPVSMVVITHANQYTTVYNAKGAAVTDRSLNSDSSWKVDSIAYINGDKYYRVATDEFVKASDVDVNALR